jgi:glycerol-3-phosphate dehydrogenase
MAFVGIEENLRQSRAEILTLLQKESEFDLIIIGGGIHGATLAKLSAQAGLKVLLLEKGDYAAGTSSRSSKMAHGGLRYLEMFDFQQVFEGVRCREDLLQDFPELVRSHPFLIPVLKGDWFFRLKLGAGLTLYDLFSSRRHNWMNYNQVTELVPALRSQQLMGCYQYFDGLMDDSALVQNYILQARAAGAICLNYAEVLCLNERNNRVDLDWSDLLTGMKYQQGCRRVVNCTGPWAELFSSGKLALSRGSHILFDVPWTGPALFLPMPGKARYYFVWPHPGGTMVGTTEREVSEALLDPLPSADEVSEIYARLAKDLPTANLNASTAYYAFAGIRALPLRSIRQGTPVLSRKHIWRLDGSVLSLLGGKFTTAAWTAREGLTLLARELGFNLPKTFPRIVLSEAMVNKSVSSAFEIQQSNLLEDYFRRRSAFEYLPGHGLQMLESDKAEFLKYLPESEFSRQVAAYSARMESIKSLLKGSSKQVEHGLTVHAD